MISLPHLKLKPYIFWGFLLILICLNTPPLFIKESSYGCTDYVIGVVIACLGMALAANKKKKMDVQFGSLSAIILIVLFLCFTLKFIAGKVDLSPLSLGVIMIYFKTLSYSEMKNGFFTFVAAALIVIYAVIILQWLEVFPSLHRKFAVTGGFLNPNHLAIYIGTLVVILIANARLTWCKNNTYNLKNIVIILIGCIFLLLLECRSAYLGILVCVLILFKRKIKTIPWQYCLMGCCLLVFIFYIMYNLKGISAEGRLYLWLLDLHIVKNNLIWGVGVGKFQINFMEEQASFFQSAVNTLAYRKFAGQIDYAFCDPLQFVIEYGVVVGTFIALLVVKFNFKVINSFGKLDNNSTLVSCYLGIIFMCVCSLTNYVFYVAPLLFLFYVLIAIISRFEIGNLISARSALSKGILIVISLTSLSYSSSALYSFRKYRDLKAKAYKYEDRIAFSELEKLYPYQKENYRYLFDMAILNRKYNPQNLNTSIAFLKKSRALYLHRTNTIVLASLYLENNEVKKAEEMYLFSHYANGQQVNSAYSLLNFYSKTGQRQNFIDLYLNLPNLQLYPNVSQSQSLKAKFDAFNTDQYR